MLGSLLYFLLLVEVLPQFLYTPKFGEHPCDPFFENFIRQITYLRFLRVFFRGRGGSLIPLLERYFSVFPFCLISVCVYMS